MLLAAASAHAQVVTSSFSPITLGPDANPSNTSQDANTQYFIFNSTTHQLNTVPDRPGYGAFSFRVADRGGGEDENAGAGSWNGGYALSTTYLAPGSAINASIGWDENLFFNNTDAGLSGGFRGVRVDAGGGNYYYGYIGYSSGAALSDLGPSIYVFSSAGIETTLNATMYAPSAVPEPSTYAAIAGAAGLGLAIYRRRRPAPGAAKN